MCDGSRVRRRSSLLDARAVLSRESGDQRSGARVNLTHLAPRAARCVRMARRTPPHDDQPRDSDHEQARDGRGGQRLVIPAVAKAGDRDGAHDQHQQHRRKRRDRESALQHHLWRRSPRLWSQPQGTGQLAGLPPACPTASSLRPTRRLCELAGDSAQRPHRDPPAHRTALLGRRRGCRRAVGGLGGAIASRSGRTVEQSAKRRERDHDEDCGQRAEPAECRVVMVHGRKTT